MARRNYTTEDIIRLLREAEGGRSERWYNPSRRHSALGYKSPNAFEATALVAAQSLTP